MGRTIKTKELLNENSLNIFDDSTFGFIFLFVDFDIVKISEVFYGNDEGFCLFC